jgi:hypothetical protein
MPRHAQALVSARSRRNSRSIEPVLATPARGAGGRAHRAETTEPPIRSWQSPEEKPGRGRRFGAPKSDRGWMGQTRIVGVKGQVRERENEHNR